MDGATSTYAKWGAEVSLFLLLFLLIGTVRYIDFLDTVILIARID